MHEHQQIEDEKEFLKNHKNKIASLASQSNVLSRNLSIQVS